MNDDVKADPNAESQDETKAEAQAESQPESQAEFQSEMQAEDKTEAEVEVKTAVTEPEGPVSANSVGRRKCSSARVIMKTGSGEILINGQKSFEYLQRPVLQMIIMQPLELLQCTKKYDFKINVRGGGKAGQAGAIRLGISRALSQVNETYRIQLRKGPFLTRDPRMKERKKYGQKGARKRFQYSKR